MSNKNVEKARKFLWDEDDSISSSSRSRAAQNSRTVFSTRDYVVDQSVNLMDMGQDGPSSNVVGRPAVGASPSTRFNLSVSGLFRATTGVEGHGSGRFDEYADAIPSADAEELIDNDKRRWNPLCAACLNCDTKSYLTFAMALIGLSLVVATLIITLADEGKSGGTNEVTTLNDQRYMNIEMRIVQEGVVPSIDVFDGSVNSPEQSALNWLVYEDQAKLPYDHPALFDRFSLALFYFSSSNAPKSSVAGGWKNSTNWMTGSGICIWHGIECVPREQEATAENEYYPFTKIYDDDALITGIRLIGNNIEGYIPKDWGASALSKLMILDLEDNDLSGTLPTTLGSLPELKDLLLKGNNLEGTLPGEFGALTKLHQLDLSKNKFKGEIPSSWTDLKEMRYFSVSKNSLSGLFPDLSKMIRLTGLFLEDNKFEGRIPDYLGTLTDIMELRLGFNKFTGPLSALTSLQNIETLYLNNNEFTGNIPDMFDQLFRLHALVMQNNQFIGTVPITLTHLQSLKTLNLAHNQLHGSIPPGLGLLTDAISISLNHNNFSGKIPTLLGKLDDITNLLFNNNSLSGIIPTELGACFRLQNLQLQSNELTGGIPSELGEVDTLTKLRFESNNMMGVTMPSQVCALLEDELSVLTADCDRVSCSCCTSCF